MADEFAKDIVILCRSIKSTNCESVLTNQLLCSGTSIGANFHKAQFAQGTNVSKILEGNVNAAAKLLNTTIFESRVRQATVVQESQLVKMDLFEYAPKAPVTKDYEAFIDELLQRIEE